MSRTISIITFYNPTSENVDNMLRIAEQSDFVIICDNSDENNAFLFRQSKKIIYKPNYDNLGLSLTFNKVLKNNEVFHWNDDDFIIFFDQDSKIENGHISSLIFEYRKLEEQGYKIGCLGPFYYDLSSQTLRKPRLYKRISDHSISVTSIMTSSMICKYKNLKVAGFWSEDIFLDMADWDLCWKMKKHGLIVAMTDVCVLTHKLGKGSRKIGLITLDVSKPFREYYQTRDCIYLLRKDYVPLKMRIRFYLQLTLRPLIHILFLDYPEERKYYIKLGFNHARKKITGKLKKEDMWDKNANTTYLNKKAKQQ